MPVLHVATLCFGSADVSARLRTASAFAWQQEIVHREVIHWTLMTGAMMLPLLAPASHYVHVRSLPRRRGRSQILLVAGFWSFWIALGTPVMVLAVVTAAWPAGRAWLAAAVPLLALAWQLSARRAISLRRCHLSASLRIRGPAANLDCLAYGARQAAACGRTCVPAMCAMTLSSYGHVAMVPMAWLMLRERSRRYREGWLMAAILCGLALAALTQTGHLA